MAESKAKIKFEADTGAYNKAVAGMQKRTQELKGAGDKLGRGFSAIGTPLKVVGGAIAAIVAAAAFAIKKFREQEVAEVKLAAALKTTNATRGVTLNQLKQIAGEFQTISLIGDEAGLEILQFGVRAGIAKENLAEFLATMADVAAATGKNAARVARAFQRGFGNATDAVAALNSVAVSLDDTQKAHLKTLFDNGKAVEAQKFILDELRKTYDGTAEALAGGAGRWSQLSGLIGDATEDIGEVIQTWLQPALDGITKWLAEALPAWKEFWGTDDISKTINEIRKISPAFALQIEEMDEQIERMSDLSLSDAGKKKLAGLIAKRNSFVANVKVGLGIDEANNTPKKKGEVVGEKKAEKKKVAEHSSATLRLQESASDDGEDAYRVQQARAGFEARQAIREEELAAKAAAEEAERARRVAEMEYQNETDRTALQMHLDGMNSEMIGFYERRRELEEAERLLLLEERTAENEAELEAVRIQKEALLAEERAANEKEKKDKLAHVGNMLKIAEGFGAKSKALQKAQAAHNLITKIKELTTETPLAAATAYNTTSQLFGLPLGPALGAIHAGLIFANSAAAVSKAKGAISAQQGGIVPGAFTPRDSVPALLQPGEMIVPIGKPFQRVEADIEARGAAKARAENNRADMPPQEVVISFADDGGLSDFLRAEGVKNNRLFG